MSQPVSNRSDVEPLVPPDRSTVWRVLALWGAAALCVTLLVPLARIPFLVPICVGGLVLASVLAFRLSPTFRRQARAASARSIVALHAVRLPIGIAFLWEMQAGRLPPLFATRAGWGDVAIGAGALLLASKRTPGRALAVWNVLGLADILLAVATANYTMFVAHDERLVTAMSRFPYGLLPTFIVPVVITTHLLLLGRTARHPRAT